MKAGRLAVCVCGLVLGMLSSVEAGVLWSADFEAPMYTLGKLCTYNVEIGQGGWWNPQQYDVGYVMADPNGGSQMICRMGGSNGYGHNVYSPVIPLAPAAGESLVASFWYRPGAGTLSDVVAITNNARAQLIKVIFDRPTGHFVAGGAGNYDTGVAFTAGSDYAITIIASPAAGKFDLVVNGVTAARNQPFAAASFTATGHVNVYGGGNTAGGSPMYSYFDTVVVSSMPSVATPVFSPDLMSISGPTPIAITCDTAGATIRCTTDGSEPSATYGTVIASGDSVTVDGLTTLKAKAFLAGYLDSTTRSQTYYRNVVWSADFEAPDYTLGALCPYQAAAGQQGWWNPQQYEVGYIMADPNNASQMICRIGGSNGYGGNVYSPVISMLPADNDMLVVSFWYRPGAGTLSDVVAVTNSARAQLIKVIFDRPTGHFVAGGAGNYDTGVAFTAGSDYAITIIASPAAGKFDLVVNGVTAARNQPFAAASFTATGHVNVYGGGNTAGGSPMYSYFDTVVVSSMPSVATPVFSPDLMSISGPTPIAITCDTAGATIRCTTDGSEPSATHGTVIASGESVTVDDLTTLKAKAFLGGYLDSATRSQTYYLNVLWSADFEAPAYTTSGFLTGQQGWWHYQDWSQGHVVAFGPGQAVRLGGATGYAEKVLSPWVANETLTDRYFRVIMTINPGAGSDCCIIRVYDNNQSTIAIVTFDQATHHILAKGDDSMSWIDTGVTYVPGTNVRLQIEENNQTFSLKVNETWAIEGAEAGEAGRGFGYVYFFGGGNNGSFIADQYTHVDDMVISALPSAAPPVFTPGGMYVDASSPITISCATPGATVYYTDNGTTPTSGSNVYAGPISVSNGMTLKAIAIAPGYRDSEVVSVTYVVTSTYDEPETIPCGAATVDGDLSDWAHADWVRLTCDYDQNPGDVAEAYYAARWQANKVYVAVKVRDTAHVLTDNYTAWDGQDAVEIYLHTDSTADTTYSRARTAQQYIVGIKGSDTGAVWTALGGASTSYPQEGSAFGGVGAAAGRVDGQWLYYEVALTPYTYLDFLDSGDLTTSEPSTLTSGEVIGLDVVAVARNANNYTGMKSENLKTGKSGNWTQFGRHRLAAPLAGDANSDGQVNFADFARLQNHYGQSGRQWSDGDFNGDGWVTFEDFAILQNHYGQTSGDAEAPGAQRIGAATGLPCGTLGLVLLTLLGLCGLKYRE